MSSALHHPLLSVAPEALRSTRRSVGKIDVTAGRAEWEMPGRNNRRQLLEAHRFPGVTGPQPQAYAHEVDCRPGRSGAIG